jgi:hypothetical protein
MTKIEDRIKIKVKVKGNGQECPFYTFAGVSLRDEEARVGPSVS